MTIMITITMVIIAVLKIIVNPIDACGSQSLDIPPQHVHGSNNMITVISVSNCVLLKLCGAVFRFPNPILQEDGEPD